MLNALVKHLKNIKYEYYSNIAPIYSCKYREFILLLICNIAAVESV